MKTRTKGFIVSFILVFAMLIGVFTIMPMTASAAPSDDTKWSVYIGGNVYSNETYIDRRESSGWVFNFRGKQPEIHLYDYKGPQHDAIHFGTNSDSKSYVLTVYVHGDCIVNGNIGTDQIAMGQAATLTVNNGGFHDSGIGGAYFRKIDPTDTTPSYIRATSEGVVMSQYEHQTFNLSDNIHVYFESATNYPFIRISQNWENDSYYPNTRNAPQNSSITCVTKSTDENVKYTFTSGNLINGGYRTVAADGKSFTQAHPDYVAVTDLTADTSDVNMYLNETVTLNTPTISPSNATVKKIIWSSANTNVATVDKYGVVTGKKIGTTTITATSFDGAVSITYNVTVEPRAVIKNFDIDIPKPQAGLRVQDCSSYTYDDTYYTAEVTWLKPNPVVAGSTVEMQSTDVFNAGVEYSVRIHFTLKDGVVLDTPWAAVYATVNGAWAEKLGIDSEGASYKYSFGEAKIVLTERNLTVPEPVEGLTPADVKGTLTTKGLTINKETWYEVKGSSLRAMAEDEQFVAGKQYKYEAYVFPESGYALASDFYLKINDSFASGNGGLWKMRTPITAKTAFSAEAVNNTLTVEYGGQVRLSVNAKGDGLEYTWRNTCGSAGAPSIGVNGHDNILLTCANAGNFTYTCTVTDKYGNSKTVEFIVMVKEKVQTPQDIYTPARPIPVGTGIEGVEDVNNVFVTKGGSITLKATYKFSDDPNDIYHGGKTPMQGELSYEWVLYILDGSGLKTVVLSTTDTLVIDGNLHETYNTNNLCEIMILLNIVNTATIGGEKLTQSHLNGCTIKVVEPEATGNLGGNIGHSTPKTRSGGNENLEGTIVYLAKDDEIVYVTEADAQGNYLFTSIPYGSYNVMVEKEGYEDYSKPVEVNAAEVDHDITIIVHVCFADEGTEMYFPATQPICSDVTDGTLGNIEYRGCITCGKFYDMEGNLIADSANDPYSLNELGMPYKAIIYPVHEYYGTMEGGDIAETYLRHRAETCLEETTYWYYCIHCRKSAGDDPSAIDMYYVASDSNQTHSYTLEIAHENYFYQGGETCKDKIWYYHACEYCYAKGTTVWESNVYGAHRFGEDATCDDCGYVHTHAFADVYSADENNHWYECACGEKKDSAAHIDENTDGKCDTCEYQMSTTPETPNDPENPGNPEDPTDPDEPEEKDHSKCLEEASGWKRFWNAIGNFFRRIFTGHCKCVCGDKVPEDDYTEFKKIFKENRK